MKEHIILFSKYSALENLQWAVRSFSQVAKNVVSVVRMVQLVLLPKLAEDLDKNWFYILDGQLILTLILRRSRTGMVWFYTSTSNKRAARPKLYTKSLTRDLKHMYSRLTLVRISINLQAPCVLYIRTGVSLLFRECFLYI